MKLPQDSAGPKRVPASGGCGEGLLGLVGWDVPEA